MHIGSDDIMEEIHEIGILNTEDEFIKDENGNLVKNPDYIESLENDITGKFTDEVKNNSQEVLEEKYSVFGNPDDKQKKLIDEMDDDFRNKMICHKLKYTEDTIEIEIDGEKIIFPKEQPINKHMHCSDFISEIINLDNRKAVCYLLAEKLGELFGGSKAHVIGLDNNKKYWLGTISTNYPDNTYRIDFEMEKGHIDNWKNSFGAYPLCIYGYGEIEEIEFKLVY